jgi:[ribosomal protein S5]-alanine N-acetyltransferase
VLIETIRLVLRPLETGDVDAVFEILHDERTTEGVSWRQRTREGAALWLERRVDDQGRTGLSMWGVVLRATGEMIGLCGFFARDAARVELGYVIHARYWRQGFGSEAASAAVELASTRGLAVFATIRPDNTASRRVAEKAGLRSVRRERDARGELLIYERPAPRSD